MSCTSAFGGTLHHGNRTAHYCELPRKHEGAHKCRICAALSDADYRPARGQPGGGSCPCRRCKLAPA